MRLYLDIETYRPKEAFIDEKIITIGLIVDRTGYEQESSKIWGPPQVDFKYFTEWGVGDERSVITKFYDYLKGLVEGWESGMIRFIEVVGFNILRFDIPLLIQKGVEYNVGSLAELNKLWHDTFTRDYFQITLPLNEMKFKGLKLEYLAEKVRERGIQVPEPFGKGEDVRKWYENREYDKIVKHLETDLKMTRIIDLNYAQLFRSSQI